MSLTINTIYGTFIVPDEKQDALISWLQTNAIKPGQQRTEEAQQGQYPGQQLITE
jgi:hypothetical protein